MSKFTQPTRSVRDIKTLAGKSDDLLSPHKLYMRLFALETERHRRMQERASAMLRVNNIDVRCAEIDQEMKQLLALIDPALSAGGEDSASAAGSGAPQTRLTVPGRPRGRVKMSAAMAPEPESSSLPVKIRY
jgi:hypothetical protein